MHNAQSAHVWNPCKIKQNLLSSILTMQKQPFIHPSSECTMEC